LENPEDETRKVIIEAAEIVAEKDPEFILKVKNSIIHEHEFDDIRRFMKVWLLFKKGVHWIVLSHINLVFKLSYIVILKQNRSVTN